MPYRLVSSILLATALCGCAGVPATRAPQLAPAASAAVANSNTVAANDNLNAVAWSQTAIEHDLIYREIYARAGEKLLRALADPKWDALPHEERTSALTGLKPAIILDIDETVLDNSPYQARLVLNGGHFDRATWAAWCRERSAGALPGALEFTNLAARHGVTVFYLSNRAQDLNDATLDNLRAAGFPIATGETVFLGLGTAVAGCEQVRGDKGCRRKLIARTHRVLMQGGDQLGDFLDIRENTLEGRRAAVAPYLDWIGERWFVLPNPTYGSWESALINNNPALPEAQQRELKRAALRSN